MKRLALSIGLTLAALSPATSAANQVHVVDAANGPGADFTSLGFAILLAGEGDILLVRPGSYGANGVTGKSLTFIGDPGPSGARPRVSGLTIKSLAAGQKVVVRGIDGNPNPGGSLIGLGATIEVRDCVGAVFVEDFEVTLQASVYTQPVPITILNSPRVTLTRCRVRGTPAVPNVSAAARPGVRITNSTVSIYDCEIEGGPGADALLVPPLVDLPSTPGATGLKLFSGTIAIHGGVVRGGRGGHGATATGNCNASSDGGAGILVQGAVTRVGALIEGGAAGVDPAGCPPVGVAGADQDVAGGFVTTIADTLRSYVVTSPARVGQPATTTFTGVPGEFCALLLSFFPDGQYVPTFRGALVTGSPFTFVGLGNVPANGVIQFTVPVPSFLPAGVEGIELYEQALVAGADGFGLLSSPTTVVVVDANH